MTSRHRQQVWGDWSRLYGATLAAQAISGARSLAVAALLGPAPFGLWKSLQLLLSYSNWCDLGAVRGMGREVPLLRGQRDEAQANAVQQGSWLLTLGPALVVAGGVAAAGMLTGDRELGRALVAFAPVLLSTRVMFYFFELANARKEFTLKSRAVLALALTDGALAPLAAWWGGVLLFMWSITATNIVTTIYLGWHLPLRWRPSWNSPILRRVIGIGLPLALSGLAFDVLKTMDRLVIVTFLGTDAVGYYGLAMIVFELTVTVPLLFGQVLQPHLVERYGQEHNAAALFAEAASALRVVAAGLPILLIPCWLLLPWVTNWLLPDYAPGIAAARVLLWAPVFLTVHSTTSVVLVALGRTTTLIAVHVGAVVLAALLCLGAIAAGAGISGVAAAMLAAYGVAAAFEFSIAGLLCGSDLRSLIRSLLGSMAVLPLAVGAAAGLEQLGPHPLVVTAAAVAATVLLAALVLREMRPFRVRGAAPPPSMIAFATTATPLVSVVLPVWNGAGFIASAVNSMLRQTYPALEVIVVDDHSDDGTAEVLNGIRDQRLRLFRLDHRAGGAAARNLGILHSRGTLIAAMDADDVSDPERIGKQVAFLQQNPDHALVSCGFDCVDAGGRVLDRVYPPTDDEAIRRLLIRANPFAHSAFLARRDALQALGGYDEGSLAQDYDLYLRLAQHWRLACLPEVLHRVLVHRASETVRRENAICLADVVARLRAIFRGQYPLRTVRHVARTAFSMLVPPALKRWKPGRGHTDRYRYYRRAPEWTSWERNRSPLMRSDTHSDPLANVESADWLILAPRPTGGRVLWLSPASTDAFVRTSTPYLVVTTLTGAPSGGEGVVGILAAGEQLPFRARCFDLVTVDVAAGAEEAERAARQLAEVRRVLRQSGTLHLGLAGWVFESGAPASAARAWRQSRSFRRQLSTLRATLRAAGFVEAERYVHLPSFNNPRYLLRDDDVRSLQFLLRHLPTYSRARGNMLGVWLQVARRLRLSLAPLAPGLSVVAHPEVP